LWERRLEKEGVEGLAACLRRRAAGLVGDGMGVGGEDFWEREKAFRCESEQKSLGLPVDGCSMGVWQWRQGFVICPERFVRKRPESQLGF
jgi:hypothetical protein